MAARLDLFPRAAAMQHSRPAGANEVGERAVVGDLYGPVDVGRVDHEDAAEGDSDVVDPVGGAEEDEVGGLQRCARWEERAVCCTGFGRCGGC
jgi:hypothetical protein